MDDSKKVVHYYHANGDAFGRLSRTAIRTDPAGAGADFAAHGWRICLGAL